MDIDFVQFIKENSPEHGKVEPSNNTYMLLTIGDYPECRMYYKSKAGNYYAILVEVNLQIGTKGEFSFYPNYKITHPNPLYGSVPIEQMSKYILWLNNNCDYERFAASLHMNFNSIMNVFINLINSHELCCAQAIDYSYLFLK